MKNLLKVLSLVLFFSTCNKLDEIEPPTNSSTDTAKDKYGIDWRLPSWATLSQKGAAWGNFGEVGEPDYIRVSFFPVNWKDINPSEGIFDFSIIDNFLNKESRPIVLRVNWYGKCAAPDWALNEVDALSTNTLVFWNAAYRNAITPLANKLAERYGDSPRIEGYYIGFADGRMFEANNCNPENEDGWGEFWMPDEEIEEAENNYDFSPTVLENSTIQLLDIFANAFGNNVGKLVFTNIDRFAVDNSSPYNTKFPIYAAHALNLGMGMRDGAIESWGNYIHPVYGSALALAENNSCRLSTDEDFAQNLGDRFWGDENEFYGKDDYIIDAMGPYTNQSYRFFVSTLRALQMRKNYVAVSPNQILELPDDEWKAKELLIYQSKTFGRHIEDTPDAFTLLGERYVDAEYLVGDMLSHPAINNGMLKIKGIERWLSEISPSEPAKRIEMSENEELWGQKSPDGIDYEYAARSANVFKFDIHDALVNARCTNGCKTEIKLSYQGGGNTEVWIETTAGNSEKVKISTRNEVRTLSIKLNSSFDNSVDGADFIVHSDGDALSILLARIVFEDAP